MTGSGSPLKPLPRRILLGELDFAELTAAVKIAEGPEPSVYTTGSSRSLSRGCHPA